MNLKNRPTLPPVPSWGTAWLIFSSIFIELVMNQNHIQAYG